jgi:hypothetical protein
MSACTDLCGGCWVTGIPTATALFAGFPSAEERVGNSPFEFSTLSSARPFHSGGRGFQRPARLPTSNGRRCPFREGSLVRRCRPGAGSRRTEGLARALGVRRRGTEASWLSRKIPSSFVWIALES